jgi:hypothetical protein
VSVGVLAPLQHRLGHPRRLVLLLLTSSTLSLAADLLVTRTANLLCPLDIASTRYSGIVAPPPPPPPPQPATPFSLTYIHDSSDEIPTWAIIVIIVVGVLFLLALAFAIAMYCAEKSGKPIFVSLDDIKTKQGSPAA